MAFPPAAAPTPTAIDAGRVLQATNKVTLPKCEYYVAQSAFSADGRLVATSSRDFRVTICEAATGRLLHETKFERAEKEHRFEDRFPLAFSPNKPLLAAAAREEIRLVDAESGQIVRRLSYDGIEEFRDLAFTADGGRLAAMGIGRTSKPRTPDKIIVWSTADGTIMREFDDMCDPTSEFYLTADDTLICEHRWRYRDPENSRFDAFDLRTGELKYRIGSNDDLDQSLYFTVHPDTSLLVALDWKRKLAVYDLRAKTLRFKLQLPNVLSPVVVFTPDGTLALDDKFYRVGDKELIQVGELGPDVTWGWATRSKGLAFSPDGRQMAGADRTDKDRGAVVSLEWSREEAVIGQAEDPIEGLAVSNDGKRLAWIGDKGEMVLYSVEERKVLARAALDAPTSLSDERSLEFSPDGRCLAVFHKGIIDRSFTLHAVPGLERTASYKPEPNTYNDAFFEPSGRTMLTVDEDGVLPWNIEARASRGRIYGIRADQARFARGRSDAGPPDEKTEDLLITAKSEEIFVYACPALDSDGNPKAQDPRGELIRSWNAGREITGFAVSPDGAWTAAFDEKDPLVLVWDARTGKQASELPAGRPKRQLTHYVRMSGPIDSRADGPIKAYPTDYAAEGVSAAAFSSDGRWLVTSRKDGGLNIWSTADWTLKASCAAHAGDIRRIRFVAGSSIFYTTGGRADNSAWSSVKQWDLQRLVPSSSLTP